MSDISVSTNTLKKIAKRNHCTVHGSKKNIAQTIWNVRHAALNSEDINMILPFLEKKDLSRVKKLIKQREDFPVKNYKNLWLPQPKPLSKMSCEELINNLRKFRNAWEKISTRNQDLPDSRLQNSSTSELRKLIKYYYSESCKNQAEEWLRNFKK